MRAYHSCYITSLPCASSHTAQPVCWRAMSPPQVPDTWYQGAGKKSWCRVMQFLHVDALCRLCSCVIAVLHTHPSSTTRAHGPTSPPTQPHPHLAFAKRVRHTTRAMEVLPADFAWVVCEVWRAWRVIGDSFAAAGCCAGHGVSAAVCVIGLQLLCVALFRGSI